jgi:hypothetical protein
MRRQTASRCEWFCRNRKDNLAGTHA